MATSVTSLGLVACADRAILAAKPFLETTALFAHNYAPDNGEHYAGIAVPVLAASAADFGPSQGYTKATGTIKPATVTLDTHKVSVITASDVDFLKNDLAPAWAEAPAKAGESIARAAVQSIMGLFTYSAADSQITQATLAALGDFTTIMAKTMDAGLDPRECVLILEPVTYSKLLAALPANVIGDGGTALRSMLIGELLGFRAVIPSPNCSKESASGVNNGVGFVVPYGAVATANRVVVPAAQGGNLIEFGTTTDDRTGFSLGIRAVIDADQGTLSVAVDALWGAALSKQSSNGAPGYIQIKTA